MIILLTGDGSQNVSRNEHAVSEVGQNGNQKGSAAAYGNKTDLGECLRHFYAL